MYRLLSIRDIPKSQYELYYSLLSDEKRERVDCFRFEDDKKRSVFGEMLARKMIAEKSGVSEESLEFSVTELGKPYLTEPEVHFSISHSGDYVLCAVSDTPVGADIEKTRPVEERLIRRVCTDEEASFVLEGSDAAERLRRFFRVWTAKEAFFKCRGTGITDLKSVSIFEEPLSQIETFYHEDYAISIYYNQSNQDGSIMEITK